MKREYIVQVCKILLCEKGQYYGLIICKSQHNILEISMKYLLESLTIACNQQNKIDIFLGSNWQIPDSYPIVRAADLRPFPCICEARWERALVLEITYKHRCYSTITSKHRCNLGQLEIRHPKWARASICPPGMP